MWSELANERNVFQKVWSRTAAMGERLWSKEKSLSVSDVVRRLV